MFEQEGMVYIMTDAEVRMKEKEILEDFYKRYISGGIDFVQLTDEDVRNIKYYLDKIIYLEKGLLDKKYLKSSKFGLWLNVTELEDGVGGNFHPGEVILSADSKTQKGILPINLNKKYWFRSGLADKRNLLQDFLEVLNTVFHECKHFEQALTLISEDIISYENFKMAKENVIQFSLYSQVYSSNYYTMLVELDSRESADRKVDEIVELIQDDTMKKNVESCKQTTNKNGYSENIKWLAPKRLGDENIQDDEMFVEQTLNGIIERSPSWLKKLPILRMKYKEDGKLKSLTEIIDDMVTNVEWRRKGYDILVEIIIESIESATVEELKECEEKYGEPFCQELYKKLIEANKKIRVTYRVIADMNKSKYERRETMLKKCAEGRYWEVCDEQYNIVNGVDVTYQSEQMGIFLYGDIKDIFIKEYDRLETDEEFKQRSLGEDADIAIILNSIGLNRLRTDFLEKFKDKDYNTFTKEDFNSIVRVLKVANSITLQGGKDYFEEFSQMSDLLMLLGRLYHSRVFLDIKTQPDEEKDNIRTTQLEDFHDMATLLLEQESNPSEFIETIRKQNVMAKPYCSKGELAIWNIVKRQEGYSVRDMGDFVSAIGKNPHLLSKKDISREVKKSRINATSFER